MHRLLQMVSVLRICLNFLQTRATFGSAVPGSKENISTKSSGGRSAKDCGCGGPVLVRLGQSLLLTWPLPYSHASLGPAMALPGPPPLPPTSPWLWHTIRSSSSSSMSESLPWSCWFCRCRLLHLRDWPTPQSLAQTAIRSHQAGNITSQQTYQLRPGWNPPPCEHGLWRHIAFTCTKHVKGGTASLCSVCVLQVSREWWIDGSCTLQLVLKSLFKKKTEQM